MLNIQDKLTFRVIDKNSADNTSFRNDGFTFDFVIRMEWDLKDINTNILMEYDTLIDDTMDMTIYNKRTLMWIQNIRDIASSTFGVSKTSVLLMDLQKVCLGVVDCFIMVSENNSNPIKRFDFMIDSSGFVKNMHYIQCMKSPISIPYNCVYNNHIFTQDYNDSLSVKPFYDIQQLSRIKKEN